MVAVLDPMTYSFESIHGSVASETMQKKILNIVKVGDLVGHVTEALYDHPGRVLCVDDEVQAQYQVLVNLREELPFPTVTDISGDSRSMADAVRAFINNAKKLGTDPNTPSPLHDLSRYRQTMHRPRPAWSRTHCYAITGWIFRRSPNSLAPTGGSL